MSSLRRFVVSLLLLLVLTLGGTLAYMQLEGWSFTDALYMAVITISTVGFGEVRALSPMGEVFTIAYIFFSVVLVGFAGASITAFLVQGELRALMKGRRMQHRIDHLKDHYIICGCGAVGREIVQEFHEEGVPYVVIELNAEDAEVPRNIDVPVLEGDATSDEVLLLAGIERAKGLISALHDDPQNVFVTLSARQLNPKLQIVSRASEEGTESKLLRAGADRVISPFEIAGRRMAATVLRPHVLSFLDVLFRQGGVDLRLEEVVVGDGSELVGKTLREYDLGRKTRAMIIAVSDNKGKPRFNIETDASLAELVLHAEDVLIAMGNDEQIGRLRDVAQN
jgi:voltage-gated potassium channel